MKDATPLESSGAEPRVVPPVVKVTVPVGVGPPWPLTTPTSSTCGGVPEVTEATRSVVVGMSPMVRFTVAEVLTELFTSPL